MFASTCSTSSATPIFFSCMSLFFVFVLFFWSSVLWILELCVGELFSYVGSVTSFATGVIIAQMSYISSDLFICWPQSLLSPGKSVSLLSSNKFLVRTFHKFRPKERAPAFWEAVIETESRFWTLNP